MSINLTKWRLVSPPTAHRWKGVDGHLAWWIIKVVVNPQDQMTAWNTVCWWNYRASFVPVDGACKLQLAHCFIKGINKKFTPCANLILNGLFGYFLVYLIKNVITPFPIQFTQIRLPSKNILSRTSIEGEAQEQFGDWISMVSSSCFKVFLIN